MTDFDRYLCKRAATRFMERLTRREKELSEMIAAGATDKEIGGALNITTGTVKAYLSRIYHKADLSSRHDLAMQYTMANLMLDPEEFIERHRERFTERFVGEIPRWERESLERIKLHFEAQAQAAAGQESARKGFE